jgi:hypothetical protein
MKTIRLNRLILRDYKGFNFTLDAGGADINVFGRNATGKTTLADAFSWLMTGKDSLGRSDFEIKNLDASGEAAHGLEHSVEAALLTDVNEPPLDKLPAEARMESVVLKKVYAEIWTRKRGQPAETFTGHTTKHYIDGVPVSERDYADRVAEIAGDETAFRLLTTPTAFPGLHWQKQRSLLLEVCGDIADADIIAMDAKLEPLTALLAKHKTSKKPFDDMKAVIVARRAEINKGMTALPIRIDEVRRGLPDVTGHTLPLADYESDVARLSKAVADSTLRLSGVDTGGGIAELSKTLAGISADLQRMETAHYNETMKSVNRLAQQISEVSGRTTNSQRRLASISGDTESKVSRVKELDADLDGLRGKWAEIDAETFADSTAGACAACGQALPAERVQDARDKALAAFNTDKADRLAANVRRGKKLAADRARLAGEIDALTKEQEIVEATVPDTTALLASLTAERDTTRTLAEDYTIIGPPHDDLVARRAEIEAKIQSARDGKTHDREAVQGEVDDWQRKLAVAKLVVDKFVQRRKGEARIEELKADEKKLAAEFERLESELFLVEQFVRTKVRLLTDRINARFETVQWKLFDVQVNQGLSECCVATVNGVPYNDGLNSAARTNAGLDIIKTLQQHYGLHAPVFIDNAESVVDLLPMNAQVIRLVVSAEDAALRVEIAREAVAA